MVKEAKVIGGHKMKNIQKSKIIILAYHRINNARSPLCVRPDMFEKQISLLRRKGFQSLCLSNYIDALKANKRMPPGKYVVVTFDGGWQDNYTNAFPILQKYGYTATIFLTVAYIGEKDDYLTWEQVMEMKKAGFEFGSHTLTHPHLTMIPLERAQYEITESKKLLESRLNEEIKAFCYPYGDYNQDIIELVEKAGYQGAVVTPHSGRCERSIYTIQRVGLYSSDTMLSFRIKTSRLRGVVASNEVLGTIAKRLKKWLKI